jgi:hypothetical protein
MVIMNMNCVFKVIIILGAFVEFSNGFTTRPNNGLSSPKKSSSLMVSNQDVDRFCLARELIRGLIEDEKCFSSESGSMAFGDVCSVNCIYEDCYEPTAFVGKQVCMDFEKSYVLWNWHCS